MAKTGYRARTNKPATSSGTGGDYRGPGTKTPVQRQSSGRKPSDLSDDKSKGMANHPAYGLKNKGANNVPYQGNK